MYWLGNTVEIPTFPPCRTGYRELLLLNSCITATQHCNILSQKHGLHAFHESVQNTRQISSPWGSIQVYTPTLYPNEWSNQIILVLKYKSNKHQWLIHGRYYTVNLSKLTMHPEFGASIFFYQIFFSYQIFHCKTKSLLYAVLFSAFSRLNHGIYWWFHETY